MADPDTLGSLREHLEEALAADEPQKDFYIRQAIQVLRRLEETEKAEA